MASSTHEDTPTAATAQALAQLATDAATIPPALAILASHAREAATTLDTAEPKATTEQQKATVRAVAAEAAAVAADLEDLDAGTVRRGKVRIEALAAATVHAGAVAAALAETAHGLGSLFSSGVATALLYTAALALEHVAREAAEGVAALAVEADRARV